MLEKHLSLVDDPAIVQNYHPDNRNCPGNLFYILTNGRYRSGKGAYFVIEEAGEYICSAGWNEYEIAPDIALLLTRMYVNTKYRSGYYAGKFILPMAIHATNMYKHQWITCNEHNKTIYKWFERSATGSRTTIFNPWPETYSKFKPIGKKTVYYTPQYVAELVKDL